MLSIITHILPLTTIRRNRMLPVAGRVLVKTTHKINATDIIAECQKTPQHYILDLRRSLGVQRPEDLAKVLERQAGDKLQAGDIIARRSGLFSQVVRAPADCQLVAILGSRVLLEVTGEPFQLRAGLTGVVTKVYPNQGAEVETSGMLIQGVWGNNRFGMGTLVKLGNTADDEILLARLDVSMRGAVIFTGHCAHEDILLAANDLPLRGLILGSMTADLVSVANQVDFPIILLEGFGRIPINSAAYKLLSSNEKRDISLNSANSDPFTGERPEVTIPLPAQAPEPPVVGNLEPGKTVRIHCFPYAGQLGTVLSFHTATVAFPSGLRAPAAEVRLENNSQVTIPLSNMDVLE
jgi:hypothetical protein